MRDRGAGPGSTGEPPVVSDEGRPFVDPPWDAPLDVERALSDIPADSKISGMFFLAVVVGATSRNIVLPSARERYVQFTFYPLAEFARLLVEASERFFPERTLRHALRTLGRSSPDAFLASTLGRVTLGSTEGVYPAVAAMANGYELNVRPCRVSILDSGARWTVVRLDKIVHFLDSHHVGNFEGLLRFAGVKGTVRIANRSPTSADLLLTWDAAR
ncbi:MAG: DUF2378 family protein [Polyangiaceae bacterium]|jgi:uncharacterized protein (TIGR02265 family)